MSRDRRLLIFKLNDVGGISLNPQITINATDTPRNDNKVLISNAIRIIKQQMVTVGLRKSTSTTTKYLSISEDEVLNSLREYL